MKVILIMFALIVAGCRTGEFLENKRHMNRIGLVVRGTKEFDIRTRGLPINIRQAEEKAMVFQKARNPDRKRVVIGPVVGFNGREYLLTSPGKDGAFEYRGILVDATSGKVSFKEVDDGNIYKISEWVNPFIWSE